jgi:hypothetical protein
MLLDLTEDLRRDGVRLLIARDVGQVRDVLAKLGSDQAGLEVHSSVRDAVEVAQGKLGSQPVSS